MTLTIEEERQLSDQLITKLTQLRNLKKVLAEDVLVFFGEKITPIPANIKTKIQQCVSVLTTEIDDLITQLKG